MNYRNENPYTEQLINYLPREEALEYGHIERKMGPIFCKMRSLPVSEIAALEEKYSKEIERLSELYEKAHDIKDDEDPMSRGVYYEY